MGRGIWKLKMSKCVEDMKEYEGVCVKYEENMEDYGGTCGKYEGIWRSMREKVGLAYSVEKFLSLRRDCTLSGVFF